MPNDILEPEPIEGVTSPSPQPSTGIPEVDMARRAKANVDKGSNPIDLLNPLAPFQKITDTLSNVYLWKRIGIGLLGGLFIWWGVLAFLATNKKLQSTIIKTGKTVASKTPQGAVANLASDAIGS